MARLRLFMRHHDRLWFTFTLIPFVLYAAILLTRYGPVARPRAWRRGTVALGAAMIALIAFHADRT